ncbi:MAG: hypothetical protein DMF90_26075 [Acidobacteria bacterium]|nr:MAG: hypothetical protein DMF90_26075 [Acidobacteriota bacterium]
MVNGAQTVGTIAQVFGAGDAIQGAKVPAKFISLGNCPDGFAADVTRAANTQNRIERRDFAALDPRQEELRIELLFVFCCVSRFRT